MKIDNLLNDHESRNCNTYRSWTGVSILSTSMLHFYAIVQLCPEAKDCCSLTRKIFKDDIGQLLVDQSQLTSLRQPDVWQDIRKCVVTKASDTSVANNITADTLAKLKKEIPELQYEVIFSALCWKCSQRS